MARTADSQSDSPHTADGRPPQEQRRLAARAAWLATGPIPRFAHYYLDDPDQDLNISVESPLGQALVGRRVGDQVEVDAPTVASGAASSPRRHQTAAPSWPRPAAAG